MILAALRARLGHLDEDGEEGSLILVLLVMLIASGLSILVVGATVRQAVATRNDGKRVHTLNAAESGLEVALGQIRSATKLDINSRVVGDVTKLPCGPFSGRVSSATTATYTVSITYMDAAGGTINCPAGSKGLAVVPTTAVLSSDGNDVVASPGQTAATGSRSLTNTYVFNTTNANIAGGLFKINTDGGNPALCLDARSANPATGTQVYMNPCDSSLVSQLWAYQPNLQLALTGTVTPTSNGMCLTGADVLGRADTVATTLTVTPCTAAASGKVDPSKGPAQQWSYNDSGQFQDTLANGLNTGHYCMVVAVPNVAGSTLVLGGFADVSNFPNANCGGVGTQNSNWVPSAAVGAGAAATTYVDPGNSVGAPALPNKVNITVNGDNLVNYKEFGRCLDITSQQVNSVSLIAYPCKQKPRYEELTWNQLFTSTNVPAVAAATGLPPNMIVTYQYQATPGPVNGAGYGGNPYCLTSTGVAGTSSSSWITVTPCPAKGTATAPQNQTWTFGGTTGSFDTTYRILDGYGHCMGLGPPNGASSWSSPVTEICTAALDEKWNAPPNTAAASTKNLFEK